MVPKHADSGRHEKAACPWAPPQSFHRPTANTRSMWFHNPQVWVGSTIGPLLESIDPGIGVLGYLHACRSHRDHNSGVFKVRRTRPAVEVHEGHVTGPDA